jgi:hypothetical protein
VSPLLDLAQQQLDLIDRVASFADNLPPPPVTSPPDPLRAAGLEPDIMYGLGVVGVFAAIDAYCERAPKGTRRKLGGIADAADWREISDMRDLFAHNFAGSADHHYFWDTRDVEPRPRTRVISEGLASTLRCGARFDGTRVVLGQGHLHYYVQSGYRILAALQNSPSRRAGKQSADRARR